MNWHSRASEGQWNYVWHMCVCCGACGGFTVWSIWQWKVSKNMLKGSHSLKLINSWSVWWGFYQWRLFNHLLGSVIINVSTKYIIIQLANGSRLLKLGCICTTIKGLRSEETWQLSLPGKTSKQVFADGGRIWPPPTTWQSCILKETDGAIICLYYNGKLNFVCVYNSFRSYLV